MRRVMVAGRLILEDRVAIGRITMEDGWITGVDIDVEGVASLPTEPPSDDLPYLSPGFVDVHVHGGGGFDAMGGAASLGGMARHLLRRGVTSFLPTAVTSPLPALVGFAEQVRAWLPGAPADGAEPLGFNLEGPFLSNARRGAHDPTYLLAPADVTTDSLLPLVAGLRLVTIAPELPGAIELIGWFK
ncbi:MAG: N-acetylglucosamine-6-phosphate deacetylase, partial [Chloroflexota bacterium]